MLKSIYVSILPVLLMVAGAYAGLQLKDHGLDWAWVGVILAAGPAWLFFMLVLATRIIARTDNNLWPVQVGSWLGLAAAVYGAAAQSPNPLALGLVIATVIGNYIYIFWYSRFGREPSEQLLVGKTLPEFQLKDADGNMFDSRQLQGGPALLLFYRGNWCPLCVAQIKEIAALYRQLADMGARVLLISPQSENHSAKLAKQFEAPMTFLVDEGSQLASKWNILAANGTPVAMAPLGYEMDTVMPTVLVVDKDGRIIFSDQTDNYRVRPTPETFIRILQEQT